MFLEPTARSASTVLLRFQIVDSAVRITTMGQKMTSNNQSHTFTFRRPAAGVFGGLCLWLCWRGVCFAGRPKSSEQVGHKNKIPNALSQILPVRGCNLPIKQ